MMLPKLETNFGKMKENNTRDGSSSSIWKIVIQHPNSNSSKILNTVKFRKNHMMKKKKMK
jgi:hypothetical protein